MSPADIVSGLTYSNLGTWTSRVYDPEDMPKRGSAFDPADPGNPGTILSETKEPMTRTVLDVFRGESGTWVAYRLPWGEVRCHRLRSFARWAKALAPSPSPNPMMENR